MPKKICHIIPILFCTFLTGHCFGQKVNNGIFTVTGIVTDAQSGEPLEGVAIQIDYKKTDNLTDSLGRYAFYVPKGKYFLKFTYVSHAPERIEITVKNDTTINVALKDVTKLLDEVIVSGNIGTQNVRSPSLGITTLSIKAINKIPAVMGEVDILRSIQTLPGVTSVGEGANGINIRGGSVEQNMIFIDDTPIFNPTHLMGLFSVFAADAIQNVELYKGGIPARFGGRTSAVLDIKTLNPDTEQFKAKIGIGLISNKLMAEVPLIKNKLSVLTAARFSYNDFWFKTFAPENMKSTRANFYDLATKVLFKATPKDILAFSNYLNNDYYRIDSLFSLENVIAKQTAFRYGHNNSSLRWNHFYNSKTNLEIVGVLSSFTTKTQSPDSVNAIDLRNRINYKSLKANLDFSLHPSHKMNGGISILRYEIQPGMLNEDIESAISAVLLPQEQGMENAVYLDDEFTVSPKLAIQGGIRVVNFLNLGPKEVRLYSEGVKNDGTLIATEMVKGVADTFWSIEPRVTGRFLLSPNQTIKFGYNRTAQFLQLISNNTTPLPNARWTLADANILPQRSQFLTFGYFNAFQQGIWEISAETYFRYTKNILDYTESANLQLNPAIETQVLPGVAKAYGLELMLTKKKGNTNGWVGYTYARALQKVNGASPAQRINNGQWYRSIYDRPHNLNIVLNTRLNKYNDWSFVFTFNSGRPFTSPTGSYTFSDSLFPVYLERNNDRVPAYNRLDFSWTINNPSTRQHRWVGSWIFTVYNIYGSKNPYSIFFKKGDYALKAYSLSVFPTPILSLAYNLKIN